MTTETVPPLEIRELFQIQIQQGIPAILPQLKPYEAAINHSTKRKEILSADEKKLALKKCLTLY